MSWTTLKVRQETRDRFREKVKGKNDDERLRILLDGNEFVTEDVVEELVEKKIEEARGGY